MGAIRQAREADHHTLVECVQNWWGDSRTPEQARELSLLLPRIFLQHFSGTSLVMDGPDGIEGFLVGFHSYDHPDEAYIHFVGVHPQHRGQGVARQLYTNFFERALAAGRRQVRAITSPANSTSIAFHRAMGFEMEEGDLVIQGIHVHTDYDGPGHDRVSFRLLIK
jgi:predicted GNAT superfamily acetyltransferase